MRKSRWVGMAGLVILVLFSLSYIWAVQSDYYGLPFGLNPPPQRETIPITLLYPPGGFRAPNWCCISVLFDLVSNGTITQGSPVVAASKQIDLNSSYNSIVVQVVLDQATPYPPDKFAWLPTGDPIASFAVQTSNKTAPEYLFGGNFTFYWPAAGSYSPTMSVIFPNGTVRYQTYSNVQIQVASALDAQNAREARIQTVLTYVIVAFVFLEGFSIVWEMTDEDKTQSMSPPAAQTRATPQKTTNKPTT